MSDETTLLFVLASVALTLGTVFVPMWRRHVARVKKERDAGRFVPRIDARGLWLVANGPVTLALGLALLGVAGLRATAELAEARCRDELATVGVACAAGGRVELELLGRAPRRVEVRLAVALRGGGEEGSTVRLAPRGEVTLAPGERRTLTARLADADGCGVGGGSPFTLVAPFGAGEWPDCSGLRLTLTVRDADGAELATGERECTFAGRDAPLRFEPDGLLGR